MYHVYRLVFFLQSFWWKFCWRTAKRCLVVIKKKKKRGVVQLFLFLKLMQGYRLQKLRLYADRRCSRRWKACKIQEDEIAFLAYVKSPFLHQISFPNVQMKECNRKLTGKSYSRTSWGFFFFLFFKLKKKIVWRKLEDVYTKSITRNLVYFC